MELRKAAPVVNDLVAEFMVIMLREYCKKEAVSAEEIESRARRMCEYYSICLACNKLKRHNQFIPRDGVLLSRCVTCTPKPAPPPPRPKRVAQTQEEYQRKQKIKQQSYWEKNKDRCLVQSRNRRAYLRGVPGSHTVEEWLALCERFEYRCVCCGEKKPLECDHVIALARVDSTNDISNIQPLCEGCNSKKGKESIDFRQTPFTKSGIYLYSPLRALRESVPDPTLDGW